MNSILNFFFALFSKTDKLRIAKNLVSELNTNLIRTIVQLCFPPLMILVYGIENFGIWIFLTNLPYLFSIFNININEASKIEMSIFYNKQNKHKLNEIFNNSIFVTIGILITLTILILFFLNFYNLDLKILDKISSDLNLILICIFSIFFIEILNSIFVSGISFFGRIDINNYLEIFFDFFSKFGVIVCGLYLGDLLSASIFYLIISLIKIITYYLFFLKFNRVLVFCNFKYFSKSEIFRLFKLSLPHYLETIIYLMRNSFQIIIIGIFFNASIVGMISSLKTIFFFFPLRIWAIPMRVLNYEFTKSLTLKNVKFIKKLLNKLVKIYFLFSLSIISFVFFFGQQIYNYWINDAYNPSLLLIMLICLDINIIILGSTFKLVSKSINKFSSLVYFDLINTSLVILLFIVFSNFFENYYLIFILNIFASIFYFMFSFYIARIRINEI